MTEHDAKRPKRDYEVGYGKPPKQTQFKSIASVANELGLKRSGKRRRQPEAIDLTRLLTERMTVTQGGKAVRMDPYEIALRAQVKKAVKDKSLAAVKQLIELAIEFRLVKPAPEARLIGNVIQISKTCPDEVWKAISDPDIPRDKRWELILTWGLVPNVGGDNEH